MTQETTPNISQAGSTVPPADKPVDPIAALREAEAALAEINANISVLNCRMDGKHTYDIRNGHRFYRVVERYQAALVSVRAALAAGTERDAANIQLTALKRCECGDEEICAFARERDAAVQRAERAEAVAANMRCRVTTYIARELSMPEASAEVVWERAQRCEQAVAERDAAVKRAEEAENDAELLVAVLGWLDETEARLRSLARRHAALWMVAEEFAREARERASPCTCGSGGHPRKCAKHPEGFYWHGQAIDAESRADEAEAAVERVKGAVAETEENVERVATVIRENQREMFRTSARAVLAAIREAVK